MVLLLDTRFLPGRRTLLLILLCLDSSVLGFGLSVYTLSSGSSVATGTLSVLAMVSMVVVGGGRVVALPGKRRFGAD